MNESFYFDLIRIDTNKTTVTDSVVFSMEAVQYFKLEGMNMPGQNTKLKEFDSPDLQQLFLIDGEGHLKLNLNQAKHQQKRTVPDVVFFHVKLTEKAGSPLWTDLYIKMILNRNLTTGELQQLQAYLIQKFSSTPEVYLQVIQREEQASITRLEKIRRLLIETDLPILIISVLSIVLVLSLGSLFIISIAYSVSICRIFKCRRTEDKYEIAKKRGIEDGGNLKEFDDQGTEETEETEDDESDSNESHSPNNNIMGDNVRRVKVANKSRSHHRGKEQLHEKLLSSLICQQQENLNQQACFSTMDNCHKKTRTFRRGPSVQVHGPSDDCIFLGK